MVRLRQDKVERVVELVPDLAVDDPDGTAELLVLGWGSSYGPIQAAARQVREAGHAVGHRRPATPETRCRRTWARCCATTAR